MCCSFLRFTHQLHSSSFELILRAVVGPAACCWASAWGSRSPSSSLMELNRKTIFIALNMLTQRKRMHLCDKIVLRGRHPAHLKQTRSLAKSQTTVSTKALSPKVHDADQMLVLGCSAAVVGGIGAHADHAPRKCINAIVRSRSKSH